MSQRTMNDGADDKRQRDNNEIFFLFPYYFRSKQIKKKNLLTIFHFHLSVFCEEGSNTFI